MSVLPSLAAYSLNAPHPPCTVPTARPPQLDCIHAQEHHRRPDPRPRIASFTHELAELVKQAAVESVQDALSGQPTGRTEKCFAGRGGKAAKKKAKKARRKAGKRQAKRVGRTKAKGAKRKTVRKAVRKVLRKTKRKATKKGPTRKKATTKREVVPVGPEPIATT